MASILAYFSSPQPKADTLSKPEESMTVTPDAPKSPTQLEVPDPDGQAAAVAQDGASLSIQTSRNEENGTGTADAEGPKTSDGKRKRRFSFRSMGFIAARDEIKVVPPKAATKDAATEKESDVVKDKSKDASGKPPKSKPKKLSREDRRAFETALTVRAVIVGPFAEGQLPKSKGKAKGGDSSATTASKPQIEKAKARLANPKTANRVIAHLKTLPADAINDGNNASSMHASKGEPLAAESLKRVPAPIHAVALDCTEAEADARHFALLNTDSVEVEVAVSDGSKVEEVEKVLKVASVATASAASLSKLFSGIRLVSLFGKEGDLGFGKPVTEPGILSGAVPTAEEVMKGIEQVTPQLMALGYASGQALLPNHSGVYPPTDRMSVITYWWGLELNLPHASVDYLANVPSIAHSVINFLTALSVADQGVREIVPFVRYISQFVDWEYNTIKGQDQGKGVVCAATWLMPAAMVPRAWDYGDPPATSPLMEQPDTPVSTQASLAPPGVASTSSVNAEAAVPQLTVTPPTLPRNAATLLPAAVG